MGFLRAERAWKQGHVVPHNVHCVIVALPLTMFVNMSGTSREIFTTINICCSTVHMTVTRVT